jgi:repressor LexA
MREIGEKVGLTSSSSVSHQLRVLEQKGLLRRDPNRPRAIEVRYPGEVDAAARRSALGSVRQTAYDETGAGDAHPDAVYVPVVGQIAAGKPSRRSKRSSRCPRQWSARARCSC